MVSVVIEHASGPACIRWCLMNHHVSSSSQADRLFVLTFLSGKCKHKENEYHVDGYECDCVGHPTGNWDASGCFELSRLIKSYSGEWESYCYAGNSDECAPKWDEAEHQGDYAEYQSGFTQSSVPLTRPMHRRRGRRPAIVGPSYHVTCRGSRRNGGLCGMIGIRSVELRGRNPSQQVVGLSVSILSPSRSQA